MHWQNYINGAWVDGANGETIDIENPATGESLGTIALATEADVDRAVEAARQCVRDRTLTDMHPGARGRLLLDMSRWLAEHRDEITPDGFLGNNAGGVLGGISSGQDIVASIALKPTSSLRLPGRSIDIDGNPVEVVTHGRHDPCVGIRATPIAEAMLAIVLMDHLLRHRAQNLDVRSPTPVVP